MLVKRRPLETRNMVTGYVVNQDRTKLLLNFHEHLDCWLPANDVVRATEQPHEIIVAAIAQQTGVQARHVAGGPLAAGPLSYILEAQEHEISPAELEEEYDAQWLTREQVMACTCIDGAAKAFAQRYLAA